MPVITNLWYTDDDMSAEDHYFFYELTASFIRTGCHTEIMYESWADETLWDIHCPALLRIYRQFGTNWQRIPLPPQLHTLSSGHIMTLDLAILM